MNDSAIEMLESYLASDHKPLADFAAEVRDVLDGMLEAYVFSRDLSIIARADEIFDKTDAVQLWKEWNSRWNDRGWPVGFTYDPSEAETDEEMMYAAAFQMAIDEFLKSDDAEEPQATGQEIADWLTAHRIKQATLFPVGVKTNAADSVQKGRPVVHRDDRQGVDGGKAAPMAGGNALSVPGLTGAGRRKAAPERQPAGVESRLF